MSFEPAFKPRSLYWKRPHEKLCWAQYC